MRTSKASNPAVAFAVLLTGVICVAVGLGLVVRVYSSGAGPSFEGASGLVFFIVGLLISFERLKRDIVNSILNDNERSQVRDNPQ